ncbi:Phage integrase, N-terminal [Escherichia coli]|uniref:Phage integrase, N-terminal n=1 Tax=Escherichia coli TaxID=562 RepID=A0A376S8Q3_ECOLX|nr:Phage integrase, N-terminal [Escherichia coli]
MSKLSSEMKALAKKAGGSFKTVNDRIHIKNGSVTFTGAEYPDPAGGADQGSPYRMLH